MRIWPRSLAVQIGLAMAIAGLAIAGLAITVQHRDAAAAAVERVVPRPAPRGLGFVLAPVSGTVLLAAHAPSIGPQVAPVVQILADGSAMLRRPAPLALQPGGGPPGAVVDAAILLPGRALRELDPAARGTLVELLGQLIGPRPVPPDRVRGVDLELQTADLGALLQWVP